MYLGKRANVRFWPLVAVSLVGEMAAPGQKQPPEAVYEKKVYSQYQSIRLKHLATFPRLRSHKCTSRVASATPGPSDS